MNFQNLVEDNKKKYFQSFIHNYGSQFRIYCNESFSILIDKIRDKLSYILISFYNNSTEIQLGLIN
jgi:hypothetical protein